MPEPRADSPDLRGSAAPSRSELEQQLVAIWEEALALEQIGVDDSFFDLGGHSLMMTRVISRVEEATKIRLSPREFMNQTLGQIAAICEQQMLG